MLANKFNYGDKEFEYLIHNYGQTWRNERKVEIPLGLHALEILSKFNAPIVEVGDVLPNYEENCSHKVVDWYSDSNYARLENKNFFDIDVFGYNCISISTIEHFGRIEHGHKDLIGNYFPSKGLQKIIDQCGKFFITWGTGFNHELDSYILSNPEIRKYCSVIKVTKDGWVESDDDEDFKIPYAHNAGTALAVIICKNFEF